MIWDKHRSVKNHYTCGNFAVRKMTDGLWGLWWRDVFLGALKTRKKAQAIAEEAIQESRRIRAVRLR